MIKFELMRNTVNINLYCLHEFTKLNETGRCPCMAVCSHIREMSLEIGKAGSSDGDSRQQRLIAKSKR